MYTSQSIHGCSQSDTAESIYTTGEVCHNVRPHVAETSPARSCYTRDNTGSEDPDQEEERVEQCQQELVEMMVE